MDVSAKELMSLKWKLRFQHRWSYNRVAAATRVISKEMELEEAFECYRTAEGNSTSTSTSSSDGLDSLASLLADVADVADVAEARELLLSHVHAHAHAHAHEI
jgi:hypothetical protein